MATFRDKPYAGFNFLVAVDPLDPATPQAGFSEVSGLNVEVASIAYRAGNDKTSAPRLIPGLAAPARVALRRGVLGDLTLHAWLSEAVKGVHDPRTVTITLLSEDRSVAAQVWTLRNAWPLRIEGPRLDAAASEVAIETLELAVESILVG